MGFVLFTIGNRIQWVRDIEYGTDKTATPVVIISATLFVLWS